MSEPAASPFPESVSALIHDARNMVSALELYCDLLEEPGVLNHPYRHYARELRRIGGPNRRLLQALSRLDNPETPPLFAAQERQSPTDPSRVPTRSARLRARWRPDRAANARASEWPVSMETDSPCAVPPPLEKAPEASARGPRRPRLAAGEAISDLAAELEANRNLLIAMVGPAVTLGMSISGGVRPVAISSDDLTRVLVNLARNAAEAMPGGGHLQISLEEGAEFLTLSFTDSGPGIPVHALESIFSPGFSTHVGLLSARVSETSAWPVQHRGLGLSIVRSLVCAAGGAVWAANRTAGTAGFGFTGHGMAETGQAANGSDVPVTGAVFLIEFPLSVPAS